MRIILVPHNMFLAMEPFHSMLDVIPIHKNATIPMSIAPTVFMSLLGTLMMEVLTFVEKLKLNIPIMMTFNDPGISLLPPPLDLSRTRNQSFLNKSEIFPPLKICLNMPLSLHTCKTCKSNIFCIHCIQNEIKTGQ